MSSRVAHPKCLAGLRGLLWVAPWVLSACAPVIRHFEIAPHAICLGTPVKIGWKTRGGSAKVTTDPPLTARSDQTYIPTTTTRFILTVEPLIGKAKSSETEATVYVPSDDEQMTSEVAFLLHCQGGRIVATAERPVHEWDPRLRTTRVEMSESREVILSHDGRQATLSADETSTRVFDGTLLAGTWMISVPLLPNESCDGAGPPPPDLFIVTAHLRCGD